MCLEAGDPLPLLRAKRRDTGIPGKVTPAVFARAPDDAAYAAAVIECAGRVDAKTVGGVTGGASRCSPKGPQRIALAHCVGRIIGPTCRVEQTREIAAGAGKGKGQHLVELRRCQQGGKEDVGTKEANKVDVAHQRLGYALRTADRLCGQLWLYIDPVRTVAAYRVS